MPSTYSDLLRLEKQANGENDSTWGTKLNTVLEMIEDGIAGRAAITHSDAANYTLTTANSATDEARNMILNIGGALTANRNAVVPTSSKLYIAKNATTGGFATTLKTTAGTGISIPNGRTTAVFCDGTNVVNAIDYLSTLTVGDGLVGSPTLAYGSDTDTGLYRVGSGIIGFATDGVLASVARSTGLQLDATASLGWASGSAGASANEVSLFRDAADTLALRRGTNAQTSRVYNTFTDASNYERMTLAWATNTANLLVENAGTGTARALNIGTNGAANLTFRTSASDRWAIVGSTGHLVASTDNTYDIGATGGTRPRSIYFGTQIRAADGLVGAPAYAFNNDATTGLWLSSANALDLAAGSGSRLRITASSSTGVTVGGGLPLSWGNSTGTNNVSAPDLFLFRGAANRLEQRNGVTGQSFYLYGTYTDASNNEFLFMDMVGNVPRVGSFNTGTGTGRTVRFGAFGTAGNIEFHTANTSRWQMTPNLIATTDNTLDIGATGATRPRSMYWGTQLLGPDGSNAAPSFSFASATTTGMYNSAGQIRYASAGTFCFYMQAAEAGIPSDTGVFTMGSAQDVKLFRDAAAAMALRNTTTAQAFRVYNTFTDASNYERIEIGAGVFGANSLGVKTAAAGTGTARNLVLGSADAVSVSFTTSNTGRLAINSSGNMVWTSDNTLDIGASGASRPRTLYLGTSIVLPNTGLRIADTNASHFLTIAPGTDITADRTLTITTGDADRTLNISAGSVTITAAGAALIDDASVAAQRATLGTVGWDLIQTQTASNSAQIDFSTGIDSTSDMYMLVVSNLVPATNGSSPLLRVSEDGGSTFKSGATDYGWSRYSNADGGAVTASGIASDTSITLHALAGSGAGQNSNVVIEFFHPSSTSGFKPFKYRTASYSSAPATAQGDGTGVYKGTQNAINAIRILMSAGNITSGTFSLYRLRTS